MIFRSLKRVADALEELNGMLRPLLKTPSFTPEKAKEMARAATGRASGWTGRPRTYSVDETRQLQIQQEKERNG